MKIYIDEVPVKEIPYILWQLPKRLVEVVKDEWFWWTKLYRYEYGTGDCGNWIHEHDTGMAESRKRVRSRKVRRLLAARQAEIENKGKKGGTTV